MAIAMISNIITAVENIVNNLGQNLKINGWKQTSVNVFIIYVDSTLWLKVGDTLQLKVIGDNSEIGEVTTQIQAIGCNTITILYQPVPNFPFPNGTFSTDQIHFKHGTINNVNNELYLPNIQSVEPLVYYVEPTMGRLNLDPLSNIPITNDAQILFLMSCDKSNWFTDDHYENVILPCEKIVNEFILSIRHIGSGFGKLSNGSVINRVNLGLTNEIKNTTRNYFSGVELKITLPFLSINCDC